MERADVEQGLTRPELCVLLAYAKMSVKGAIAQSDLAGDPSLVRYFMDYFPDDAKDAAGDEGLDGHRLRREIITSQLTNDVVDLMGATFVHRLVRDTGQSADVVVRAWVVAAGLADHRGVMRELSEQGKGLRTSDAYRWLLGLARVLERTTRWVLSNTDSEGALGILIKKWRTGLGELRERFGDLVTGPDRSLFERRVEQLEAHGADPRLARRLMTLRFLDQLLEILRIGEMTGAGAVSVGEAYYAGSESLGIPLIREQIASSASEDRWEQRAALALTDDLSRVHHRVVCSVMDDAGAAGGAKAATDRLLKSRNRYLDRVHRLTEEIRGEEDVSLAGISVVVRELSAFAARLD